MNKANGGDGIPVELFQIMKDDTVEVLHSICQQIWKIQQWPQDWKMSVFIAIPKKGNAKEWSNYHTIALISHASKVMLKILQDRFSSTWTMNFQMFKPTSAGSLKKQECYRKISISALLTVKAFDCVDHNKLENSERWEYQNTWPASWETCMQVRKQQLELDMDQQTGSKQEKEYVKAVYYHYAYLTYMQSTSWEMLG